MTVDPDSLRETMESASRRLVSEMTEDGYWEGRLSSSALATAVAAFALWTNGAEDFARRGFDWLVRHVNDDGGWGDTPDSPSNFTTTLLSWCALSLVDPPPEPNRRVVAGATRWLCRYAGGTDPDRIVSTVISDYGSDKTFSAPILTMCVLAGKLDDSADPWSRVPALPFELSVLPHSFFRWLRMPVVSYALPALISIGLVRHRLGRRGLVSPARAVRDICTKKAVKVLRTIQPESGGYLEAAPLTSFVAMSMTAAGYGRHESTRGCIEFLKSTVRDDGSWPIDTNLATWLTSLSVRALHAAGSDHVPFDRVRSYLLDGQTKSVHPFTRSAPGGWAWTHLTGGVPDADDTAAALVALHRTGEVNDTVRNAAENGIRWLIDLQNMDGGMPTFCKGWGRLPFDRSCPDITAHALTAFYEWWDDVSPKLRVSMTHAAKKAVSYLNRSQRTDGAWVPLWFGTQYSASGTNPTYGTARVLDALKRIRPETGCSETVADMVAKSRAWLVSAQNTDGGWGSDQNTIPTIEETALAVKALAGTVANDAAVERGVEWLINRTKKGTTFPSVPIGLYFARLWYSETLYPMIFTIDALASYTRHI